jgi:serine/threonine-protein kinase
MLEVGVLLQDRYEIQRVLGLGGMACVYLAIQPHLGGKPVAIKEFSYGEQAAGRADLLALFRSEAQTLARLSHPGLVAVTDFFEHEREHYLVMEYVEGQTLTQRLRERERPFDVSDVMRWGNEICDVLIYLHSQQPQIILRDLKPANIMLDGNGRIRVIDFGLARHFDASKPDEKTHTLIRGCGTPGFAPLEQYGGGGTDVRTDIYALGATLYCLLTRQVPVESVDRVTEGTPLAPPSTLNPLVGPGLETVILKCMATLKKDRYDTVRDVKAALRDLPQGMALPLAPLPLAPATAGEPATQLLGSLQTVLLASPPPPPSSRRWLVWGASSLLAVTSVAAWWATSSAVGGAAPAPSPSPTRMVSRPAPSLARLQVRTQPPHAQVIIDDRPVGRSPLTIKAHEGIHHVTIRHAGFDTATRAVAVHGGVDAAIDVTLSKAAPSAAPHAAATVVATSVARPGVAPTAASMSSSLMQLETQAWAPQPLTDVSSAIQGDRLNIRIVTASRSLDSAWLTSPLLPLVAGGRYQIDIVGRSNPPRQISLILWGGSRESRATVSMACALSAEWQTMHGQLEAPEAAQYYLRIYVGGPPGDIEMQQLQLRLLP